MQPPAQGAALAALHGVARGMEWLHARGVLHGDLKAANILLASVSRVTGCSDSYCASSRVSGESLKRGGSVVPSASVAGGQEELVPKVADFGLSR
mgnify:CR=1 FL=1